MSTYTDGITALSIAANGKFEIITTSGSYLVQDRQVQIATETNGISIKDVSGTTKLVYIPDSTIVTILKK